MKRSSGRKTKVIGLTGGIGAGKTFVASIFRQAGAAVIDADRISHKITRKDTPVYRSIVKAFGAGILDGKGNIDRPGLADIVFSDPKNRKLLEELTHPEIIRQVKREIKKAKKKIVVIDAPLLVEAGMSGIVDALVVVRTSKERQITRCIRKFAVGRQHVLKRMRSQISLKKKLKMADFVIQNSQAKSRTRAQVRKLWGEIAWK